MTPLSTCVAVAFLPLIDAAALAAQTPTTASPTSTFATQITQRISDTPSTTMMRRVSKSPFGRMPDGTQVDGFAIRNASGTSMHVITYGGIITSFKTADRHGQFADIVLGYENLDGYLKDSPYFGAIVGRYANRIAKGRFMLDGKAYQLPINNPPNSLHGGTRGLDKVVWAATPFDSGTVGGIVLRYSSPDGDQGYPGQLDVSVTYTLSDDNRLTVGFTATTDKATPVNLSQHTYFNLAGDDERDILGHLLRLRASTYTPVDSTLIPTGELRLVRGTPFDFRTPTAIGARIGQDDEQLRFGRGYDHNFVLDGTDVAVDLRAHVVEPISGRTLDVYTDQPGIQFYSGNFLDGSITGKSGRVYKQRYGFCLETQHFPDAPNKPGFPSTILRPGQHYQSVTVYAFGVDR